MRKFSRSAITGRFASKQEAADNPNTTVTETTSTITTADANTVRTALVRAMDGSKDHEEHFFYKTALDAFGRLVP